MNPDMHTTLWNVNIRKPIEMILTVFRAATLREWEPTLKERGGFW